MGRTKQMCGILKEMGVESPFTSTDYRVRTVRSISLVVCGSDLLSNGGDLPGTSHDYDS